MLPKNVIGCQFPSFEWSPNFGIRVIMPLLMYSEVNPCASMALKASNSVGGYLIHILLKEFCWDSIVPWGLAFGEQGDGFHDFCQG